MTPPALVSDDARVTEDPVLVELCSRIVEQLVAEGFVFPADRLDGAAAAASREESLESAVGRAVIDSCRAAAAMRPTAITKPKGRRHLLHLRPSPARVPPGSRLTLRRGALSTQRRNRLITTFAWVQNIGAVLVLFAAWQVWGTAISEHHAQHNLALQFASLHHPTKPTPSGAGSAATIKLVARTTNLPNPPQGKVMAHLQIPVIGIDQYVVSGTAASDLALGPGHYDGTALPGQAGNVAIAGHRTTHGAPFYHLGDLTVGEEIILTTSAGQALDYYVSAPPRAVSPSDTSVLGDFGDNRLTLTTCTPPYSAAQRLVVVATLRLPGIPIGFEHLSRTKPKPYRPTASTNTSSWDFGQLPLVALGTLILLGLGIANRYLGRVYGRLGRWVVLTPIWVAALYVLFDALTKLLPASV